MEIKKTSIPYASTGYFSKLVLDYISGSATLKPFYSFPPLPASFKTAVTAKTGEKLNRELLVNVLCDQYSGLPSVSEATRSNIRRLADSNTFTVTTGHQLCLFTGPLYFIYKIITTINLSEQLNKQYPDNHFVPVYWMAGEDHDFDEINHFRLFGNNIAWRQNQKGAAGKISTQSLRETFEELKGLLGESENAKKLLEIFQKAYFGNPDLSSATRCLVNELFGKYGLVILDPDRQEFKSLFAAVIKEDLFSGIHQRLVLETVRSLESSGYKAQVTPREINFFYLRDGSRERIEKSAEGEYQVLNTAVRFSAQKMEEEIDTHPERFSPNVVVRPLYQQMILPNVAYVGGGAEIAYWLEYKKLFDHHKISFPILILRNSVMMVDRQAGEKWNKLGFSISDLFKSTDELCKIFVSRHAEQEGSSDIRKEADQISSLLDAIIKKALAVDPTLKASAESEKQKNLKLLEQLQDKILKAYKKNHEISLNQIKKIKEKLFPEGSLQERTDNITSLYLQYGDQFIDRLNKELDPFSNEFTVINL